MAGEDGLRVVGFFDCPGGGQVTVRSRRGRRAACTASPFDGHYVYGLRLQPLRPYVIKNGREVARSTVTQELRRL